MKIIGIITEEESGMGFYRVQTTEDKAWDVLTRLEDDVPCSLIADEEGIIEELKEVLGCGK